MLFRSKGEIGKVIERRCEMAQYLRQKVDASKDFVRLNEVDINSVMFMYVKDKQNIESLEEVNRINKKIKEKIDSEGKFYLHQFSIFDDNGVINKGGVLYPLRYMSGNDNINKEDIDEMLDYIREVAVAME